ncbi:MAG: hypothetical protein KBE65_13405 [Phycisphaerae bacterium]|nr:hypothetical protein [Phycisphaerae bacterium]
MVADKCDPFHPELAFNRLADILFQRELLRGVMAEYGVSYSECAEKFGSSTLDDVLPYYRRAKIEELFVELAGRAKGCAVRTRQNDAGNCSHNVLFIGEKIALTQSKIDDRYQLPRDATFRDTYARSPQSLFAFMHDEATDADTDKKVLYGIITHSPTDGKCLPAFVDVLFPDPVCRSVVGVIRLMEKFPDVVDQIIPAEEVVRPEIGQKLRLKQSLSGDATA